MNVKQKILSRIGFMITILSVVIIAIVLFNFRSYGINSAIAKAKVVSELVKSGLTAHMVNGNMDKRDVFLKNIMQMKNVDKLWVVRGEKVIKQYGEPHYSEVPRDSIDKEVLKSGKLVYDFDETIGQTKLRVTIPYRASLSQNINCLQCHDVKRDDILGAVSVEFDIMDMRQEGISTIVKILGTTIIAIILIILATNKLLEPYLQLFDEFRKSINKASSGNFSGALKTNLKDEIGDMVNEYDRFLTRLDNTFGTIDKELKLFVANDKNINKNPLEEAGEIVTNIAELYKFKKAIELDRDKETIYKRFAYVLKHRFKAKNFSFLEVNDANEIVEVYREGNVSQCSEEIVNDCDKCRSKRTGVIVNSGDFPEICRQQKNIENYICIPVNIGGKIGLIIKIEADSKELHDDISKKIPFIIGYAGEASPMIESKKLLQILKESSLKDGLTGLYNRRFLDEYVEKLAPQAIRQKQEIGVLMIDMDHFKMVNDTYGHDVGDAVLKTLSAILRENVRESDLVVRYGGEEFIILLVDANEANMMRLSETIRKKVEEKIINIGNNKTLKKTISIGSSIFPNDSTQIWQVIKYADTALYEAKHTGRNKTVRFTTELWDENEDKF